VRISSPAFAEGQEIPRKYTCDGENVNPPLIFADVPKKAKSLVVIVDDPDAPGDTFTHWVVWRINPSTTFIEENSVPDESEEGKTDFGKTGYGGPCPPGGTHRYRFKLYALDTDLDFVDPANTVKGDVEKGMEGNILAQALLVGIYSR